MVRETNSALQHIAEVLSIKWSRQSSLVVGWVRVSLSFSVIWTKFVQNYAHFYNSQCFFVYLPSYTAQAQYLGSHNTHNIHNICNYHTFRMCINNCLLIVICYQSYNYYIWVNVRMRDEVVKQHQTQLEYKSELTSYTPLSLAINPYPYITASKPVKLSGETVQLKLIHPWDFVALVCLPIGVWWGLKATNVGIIS